ncbi:hypothetical protein C4K68_10115 [Pokkaliibacter plantistimulans]|uniref:Uncharacterized protein n=1 Tax=Proteobacteria bacterium 228 TaxID=2083153 RepID=A0A2S5KRQ1_9PROT|nr:hypothetical protein C4K68_10115 [Pokkaliibacter plantistimulans]
MLTVVIERSFSSGYDKVMYNIIHIMCYQYAGAADDPPSARAACGDGCLWRWLFVVRATEDQHRKEQQRTAQKGTTKKGAGQQVDAAGRGGVTVI